MLLLSYLYLYPHKAIFLLFYIINIHLYLLLYYFLCWFSFLLAPLSFHLGPLAITSAWRTPFSISRNAGLLVRNSPTLCRSETIFLWLLSLTGILGEYEMLHYCYFLLAHCLLTFMVVVEKMVAYFTVASLKIVSLLTTLKICFLFLVFSCFTLMY